MNGQSRPGAGFPRLDDRSERRAGERVVSLWMPYLRKAAYGVEPGADLRRMSGVVSANARGGV
jgi:hypothetical protein